MWFTHRFKKPNSWKDRILSSEFLPCEFVELCGFLPVPLVSLKALTVTLLELMGRPVKNLLARHFSDRPPPHHSASVAVAVRHVSDIHLLSEASLWPPRRQCTMYRLYKTDRERNLLWGRAFFGELSKGKTIALHQGFL